MHAFYMYSKWASLRVSLGQWNSPNIIYSLSLTWYHGTMLPYSYQVGHFNSNACMHTCTVCNVQYYVPYNQKLSRDKISSMRAEGQKRKNISPDKNFRLYCICQYMYNIVYLYRYNPQIPIIITMILCELWWICRSLWWWSFTRCQWSQGRWVGTTIVNMVKVVNFVHKDIW